MKNEQTGKESKREKENLSGAKKRQREISENCLRIA